jgi:hypothetical protein
MAKRRHEDLAYWRDEVIMIKNRDELELLLARQGAVFDRECVVFAEPDYGYPPEPTTNDFSVASAIDQVVAAGILPAPKRPLPPVGARVETMEVGGKPPPRVSLRRWRGPDAGMGLDLSHLARRCEV